MNAESRPKAAPTVYDDNLTVTRGLPSVLHATAACPTCGAQPVRPNRRQRRAGAAPTVLMHENWCHWWPDPVSARVALGGGHRG